MWGQPGFREEEKIRGVVIQHRNDVDHGGAVGLRFLTVYGEDFEFYGRRGGGRIMVGCRGPSSSGRWGGGITVLWRDGPLGAHLG